MSEKKLELASSIATEARKREVQLLINIAEPDPEYQPLTVTDEATLLDCVSTEPTEISSRLSAYFGTDLGLDLRMPVWRLVDRIKQLRPSWPENEQPRFDPRQLTRVTTVEDIRALPQSSEGLFVYRLDDAKLAAIAGHLPALRHLIADGSTRVTDGGLQALADMHRLECLDLEWSGVTDRGLLLLASIPSLQWIDIGFCEGVSSRGVAELRRLRPDLEVVQTAG